MRRDCWDWDDGWRNFSAGWMHNCGILADGRLICFGNNDYGEMGHLAMPPLLKQGEPKCQSEDAISSKCHAYFEGKWALTEFGGVDAGRRTTCAIKCVDDQADDVLDEFARYHPPTSEKNWPNYPPATCSQGRVVCWGDNRLGQGQGGLEKLQGGLVAKYDDFISVCAGAAHSCGVRAQGSLHCWGHDGNNRATVPQRLVNRRSLSPPPLPSLPMCRYPSFSPPTPLLLRWPHCTNSGGAKRGARGGEGLSQATVCHSGYLCRQYVSAHIVSLVGTINWAIFFVR